MIPDEALRKLLDLPLKTRHQSKDRPGTAKFSILPSGESFKFDINPYKKECLMKGLDDIDYLLGIRDLITTFEMNKRF